MENLYSIIAAFQTAGEVSVISPFGSGHINRTYLVTTTARKYILQKINHQLFGNVEQLMHNIRLTTEFIRAKLLEEGGERVSLNLVDSLTGTSFVRTEEGYYRMYHYIDDSVCYQLVAKPQQLYEAAVGFGSFARQLADFPAEKLFEILPDFHNTRKRYANFEEAVAKDIMNRKAGVLPEIAFIRDRRELCGKIVDLLAAGKMPLKVTHNDTKLNNVLFHKDTDKFLAIVDFDTIMPGSLCYDFGDAIRFGCSSALEDEQDLSRVHFLMELFSEFSRGYLSALGKSITQVEKDHLASAAILMTLECGMRFLTDYLQGDTYFKTSRPHQNLDRCRTQLLLVRQMEEVYPEMQRIIDHYYHKYCC
jgi:Ser/Thr protein kinase RdoA (MazF antagonist)